jgi:phage-related protein
MLEIVVPVSDDMAARQHAEVQIIQQITYSFNPGWIKTKQHNEDTVVKIIPFYRTAVAPVSSSHRSVVLTDFPSEKTPIYQKHLLYTLLTSSDL